MIPNIFILTGINTYQAPFFFFFFFFLPGTILRATCAGHRASLWGYHGEQSLTQTSSGGVSRPVEVEAIISMHSQMRV